MSSTREAPNPLRPYYKPPSIGIPQDAPGVTSSGTHGLGPKNGSAASYASSARGVFSDIDYTDYLTDSSSSSFEAVHKQINEWMYRYFSILLAQPFDVAKTILQIRSQAEADGKTYGTRVDGNKSRKGSVQESAYSDYPEDDSDPDEPAYFTSNAPSYGSFRNSRTRRDIERDTSPSPKRAPTPPAHQLVLKQSDSILEVISQEWTKEGAWGVWKGSNTTWVYQLLHETLEKWSRGLLSAMLNVPETLAPALGAPTDVLDSPYPWASLGVAVAASVSAGLVLAPLDLVRTRILVTPIQNHQKRSLIHSLRTLPSYLIPSTLILPTILHSLIQPLICHSTPILLRSRLSLDPVLTPGTYSLAKFMSRTIELFVKLPFETVLRRGQVAVLGQELYLQKQTEALETVVRAGEYRGVASTMWLIAREEGVRESVVNPAKKGKTKAKVVEKRGQGIEGLWRGWRVGMWGLVGIWGAGIMGGVAGGEEF